MLTHEVPSTTQPDSATAATTVTATSSDGQRGPESGLEEPEPPATAALAALTPAFLPPAFLPPLVEFEAQISVPWSLLALASAGLTCFGAVAAGSLIGYSPTRLAQRLDEQRRKGREQLTEELSQRDREYFVVATAYAGAGWVLGLWALSQAIDPANQVWALILWSLLMLFGTAGLPIAFADSRAERTVLFSVRALRFGWYVLRYPIVLPLLATIQLFVRALRLKEPVKDDPTEVQKQVMAAVADTVDQDELADAERAWIGNIVTLKDLQVATVMTPRPDIIALPESMTLHEAVEQALEHEFSRYPVYRERLDDVVGIFYVKDALRLLQKGLTQHGPRNGAGKSSAPTSGEPLGLGENGKSLADTSLSTLLRDPLFVPEVTGAAQLLRRMQTGNQHMAIIIDEYGTPVGLATVEDLIEEIVGEIEDEYDPPNHDGEDQVRVVEVGRVVEIPARTSVLDLNKLIGTHVSDDGDFETVAGLVIAECNRIPKSGETVVVNDVEFRVLQANERRVQRLRVTALTPQTEAGEAT
ncbi:MAG: hemolysin family protein [Planctomycetota bacterium]